MFIVRLKVFSLLHLWLFSLCVFVFAYGVAVGRYRIFPYETLRDAQAAAEALLDVARGQPDRGVEPYKLHVRVPTAVMHSPLPSAEMILVAGGAGYHKDRHPHGCLAWVMDRKGKIKHFWRYDPHLWSDLKVVTRVRGISGDIYPVGMHVFDNGELLVTYQSLNTFPFALGIARFDRDSNVLWKKECLAHHYFSVANDGRIFVPALKVVDSPVQIGNTAAQIESSTGKVYHDTILILDPDGNVLEEISMFEAVFESGWEGLFTRLNESTFSTDDPLHLNDVQFIGDELPQTVPWLSPEDLLISFRNINAVGILDIQTRRFKWMSSGATVGQHSPRIRGQSVLVLDNLGGDVERGGTQLVNIDIPTGAPSVAFPQQNVALPDRCRTTTAGHLDLHQGGKRVLLTLTHQGAIWDIDLASGEVAWEYAYVHPNEDGARHSIALAKYVDDLSFLGN